jgi:hypothetical protein
MFKRLLMIALLMIACLAMIVDTASAFGRFRRCGGGCFSGFRHHGSYRGCSTGGCNTGSGGCYTGGCSNGGCNPGMGQPAAPGAAPTYTTPTPGPAPTAPAPAPAPGASS